VFLVRTDWLQACFDGGRSCFNPFENVLGPANVDRLAPAWRAAIGADGGSSPVYANGRLFVGGAAGLYGIDPTTGAIIVICRTAAPVVTTPAVIRGFDPQPDPPGKVIFGSADGNLYAMSTAGGLLWQVGLGAPPASPLVIQGIGDPNVKVIVGAGNTLFAFDGNGDRQWATVLEGGDISKAPALLVEPDTDEIVVSAGNTLHAVDAGSGAVLWSTVPYGARLGAPSIGDPSIVGDPNILVGDQAGNLFSVDPVTGRVVASFQARGPISGSVAVGDPNEVNPWGILGDGGGNIYAFDQTDDFPPPVWEAALGGPVDGPPVLANGVVYVGTDPDEGNPHIFALDQGTGRVLFDGLLPGGIASSPIVADGRLVVATKSGDVLAYDGPDS
jgi:outer membrane protein assembly factor BamB